MGQGEKRLAQMRSNPRGDWRISDIEVICREYGIDVRMPARGSHIGIRHPMVGSQTIPARRPIKPIYIKEFVAFVDALTGRK